MKCGAIRGITGGKIPFAPYDTLSFLIVLSFLLARRAPISEPINRFDDKFHLGARVHKKIPEYKMYSGTDNLKYTRGTTRIDKTIKSYPLSRLTRVHV